MPAIIHTLTNSEAEAEEWRQRCDMAAVFRICARLNWNEQIGNHNSLILPQARPGDKPLFMINPRGYRFEELTASSLIVCDLDGKVVRGKGELR
jgi:ribulose-5-phosphate 4-epimerase/fuculose-1-phosphate aldolase